MKRIAIAAGSLLAIGLAAAALVVVAPGIEFSPTAPDTGPYLTVDPTGESPNADKRYVAFDELTIDQQAAFERALDKGGTQTAADVDPDVWYDYEYVSYQETFYRITIAEH